jgi:CRP-like cAMP-binding protein
MNLAPLSFLFMEGDAGDKMYIIRKGLVRIMKREGSHMSTLADLGPGSILGEMSLLDKQPRSATAKTLEATELVVIDQAMLESTYAALPAWLTSIIRMVVQRLRETTARKYSDDICNAIPSFLFLLQSQEITATGQPLSVNTLSYDMKSLYGLSTSDVRKALQAFVALKLIALVHDGEKISITRPSVLKLCYKYFQDKSSPKPSNENIVSKEEDFYLKAVIQASDDSHDLNGAALSRVTFPQVIAAVRVISPDLEDKPLHLVNLALSDYVKFVPNLLEGQTLGPSHQVAFDRQRILDIIELNRVIKAFQDDFINLVISK